jgi:hypothetical protein
MPQPCPLGRVQPATCQTNKSSTLSKAPLTPNVNDALPHPGAMWTRHKLKDSTICQDNLSAMFTEKNGEGSNCKQTRHVNFRCFFVKDRVASKDISINLCPTGGFMTSEFLTRPLQESQFRKFHDEVKSRSQSIESNEGPCLRPLIA